MADLRRLGSLGPSELTGRGVRLERLADRHREDLRAACAADQDIWDIYPYSMLGEHFDTWWSQADNNRFAYVILTDEGVVGVSSYYDLDVAAASVAIGGTYFVPAVRGTGVNGEVKRLMLDAAFGVGARRLIFHIDAINGRSRAAVEKLGAVLEEIRAQDRVTWTGRVRDTCIYSISAEDWPALRRCFVPDQP